MVIDPTSDDASCRVPRRRLAATGLCPAWPPVVSPNHLGSSSDCPELLPSLASFPLPRRQTCPARSTSEPAPNARTTGRGVFSRFRGRLRTLLRCASRLAADERINGSGAGWPYRALSSARLPLRPYD